MCQRFLSISHVVKSVNRRGGGGPSPVMEIPSGHTTISLYLIIFQKVKQGGGMASREVQSEGGNRREKNQ